MQRWSRWVISLDTSIAIGCVALLSGCGSQTVVKTVTTTKTAPSPTTQNSTEASAGSAHKAKVGDTLTLPGNTGESLAVTVNGVIDPLPQSEFDTPEPGSRFVGIEITLKNVGSKAYSDSPSNGATLLSTTNEQANSTLVASGPCGSSFASSVKIAPGDLQRGCIPFQLPQAQQPGTFQFTLNSGFADQTGQWSLAGASTSPGTTPATGSPATGSSAPSSSGSTRTSCGGSLSAGPNTSCPFAANVRSAYDANGPGTYTVKSPTTGQSYSMTCTDSGREVVCVGGNGASVYFSP